jgi:hypothetical protein
VSDAGYTAEARPVAEEYARNLTTQRLARDIDTDPQVRSGINLMQTAGSGGIDNLENMLQTAYGYKPEQAKETVEKVRKAVGGYLYKGEIPDEILPRFLDLDKPVNKQPNVMDALRSEGRTKSSWAKLIELENEIRGSIQPKNMGDDFLAMFGESNIAENQEIQRRALARLNKMDLTSLVDKEMDA